MRRFFARLLPPASLAVPAVVSGLLVTLSFPMLALGWLSFVALVPVFVAVHRCRPDGRTTFRTGFLFGFTCYLSMLWWIVKLVPAADVTIPWLLTPALVLLTLYLSVYPAFFFLLGVALARGRTVAAALVAPSLWVLLEAVRARWELGFPWGSLGYALSYMPPLTQAAAVGGLPLLSFFVVSVNVLFAGVLAAAGTRSRIVCGACAVAVVAGAWWYGTRAIERFDPADARPVRVAAVQPNVDLAVKWKPEFRDSTLRLIERLARESAAGGAELVVFPETSAPVYIESQRQESRVYRNRLMTLARSLGVPVYIGFLDHRFGGPDGSVLTYNSSGLFRPDGVLEKYAKVHLLPFSEALPASGRFRWLRRIDFGQANFDPGPVRPPLDCGVASITPLICFESVFPDLCARGVREGSDLFVNITNDGWFSDTPGPYQHAQMCVLRAVEFRRWLVRSANTGVSMIVAPTGEVVADLALFEEGILIADVAALSTRTFYSRHGDTPALIVCVLLLAAGALAGRRVRGAASGDVA